MAGKEIGRFSPDRNLQGFDGRLADRALGRIAGLPPSMLAINVAVVIYLLIRVRRH